MNRQHTRVAVVTGGASGIGRAFAERLGADGAAVAVLDVGDASEPVERIQAAGGTALAVRCDVGDPGQVAGAYDLVRSELGPASIVVNSAGIYPHVPFAELDHEEWRRVMRTNLDAMFLVCAAFVPDLRQSGWGRVVNVSSASIALTDPGFVAYMTSKAGVIGFTRALANDLGDDGVTVNAIAPGLIRTPTAEAMWEHTPLFEIAPQSQVIKRAGEPGDLVGALSFLTSDESSFMTGQTLVVDGGRVRLG